MFVIEEVYTGDGAGTADNLATACNIARERCFDHCYKYAVWHNGIKVAVVSDKEITTY
jgi:hypothetical protein